MSDVEVTICSIKQAFVFKVPPLASAQGYKAADWDKEPIWTGRCRVVRQGDEMKLLLEHTDKPGLFVGCSVSGNNVEPVTDSSRYFAIRVQNANGAKATLGLGFNSRDEAFDFKVALQDVERTKADNEAIAKTQSEPPMDFSLKGPIKLGSSVDSKTKKVKSGQSSNAKIAPPPAKPASPTPDAKPKAQKGSSQSSGSKQEDLLGFDDEYVR
ncbi:hypothetical protein PBRA_004274 [Plasmodiophora brassicae]|uniref:NECAP PHear domain-containing protein n=1 Tax=Plasmodiophora brassicae TaxID=37360 RepID=A0A0G4IK57_PLABS|nr:hypothetical protein PBRA_004274 [Plasmodiophora brassicae]